jgi:hypothetical protein
MLSNNNGKFWFALHVKSRKHGDCILGHATAPGRHVGIRVAEQILES